MSAASAWKQERCVVVTTVIGCLLTGCQVELHVGERVHVSHYQEKKALHRVQVTSHSLMPRIVSVTILL